MLSNAFNSGIGREFKEIVVESQGQPKNPPPYVGGYKFAWLALGFRGRVRASRANSWMRQTFAFANVDCRGSAWGLDSAAKQ